MLRSTRLSGGSSGRSDETTQRDASGKTLRMKQARMKGKIDSWYTDNQSYYLETGPARFHHQSRVQYILKTVNKYFTNNPKIKILDAGCGDGVITKVLTDIENSQVYGIDYNDVRVKRAAEYAPKARVLYGSIDEPVFTEETFDVILLHHVLEHIEDDIQILNNLAKLLKLEGILILGLPNEGCFLAQFRNNILQRSILRNTDHVHFYNDKKIRRLIDKTDLKIAEKYQIGFATWNSVLHLLLIKHKWAYAFLRWVGSIWTSQADSLFYVLQRRDQNNRVKSEVKDSNQCSPGDIRCLSCRTSSARLVYRDRKLTCNECGAEYAIKDNVYWMNEVGDNSVSAIAKQKLDARVDEKPLAIRVLRYIFHRTIFIITNIPIGTAVFLCFFLIILPSHYVEKIRRASPKGEI